MRHERSRSPLRCEELSQDDREALLADFAKRYWIPPDGPGAPPFSGSRAAQIVDYRIYLVEEVEGSANALIEAPGFGVDCFPGLRRRLSKFTVAMWCRFTVFDDLAKMSDVLFRGPIEARHADEVDLRLHRAWRRLHLTIPDLQDFAAVTADHRISAVNVAMMLETARPPEASAQDGGFELPDARTLSSLLSLRCDRDDEEELSEMYRLLCQKLQAVTCDWCNGPFEESNAAGVFDGAEGLVMPATVPKVLVPQCGHAVHTLCFGSQLVPDRNETRRGFCRRCGLDYAWTSIDLEPMVNGFCLLFGPYVDKRTREMGAAGELSQSVVLSVVEVCKNFSLELGGLMSAPSVWQLLVRRHSFKDRHVVDCLDTEVMRLFAGSTSPFLENPELSPNQAISDDGQSSGIDEIGHPEFLSGLQEECEREQAVLLSPPSSPAASEGPVEDEDLSCGSLLPPMPAGDGFHLF